jgi:hypothetical protein
MDGRSQLSANSTPATRTSQPTAKDQPSRRGVGTRTSGSGVVTVLADSIPTGEQLDTRSDDFAVACEA